MTILAWINEQTNICENTSLDDRPASEVQIPGYIMLDLEQTPSVGWQWNGTDWVMVEEAIGDGGINDQYIDGMLVEPRPAKPPEEQPVTSGTQEL